MSSARERREREDRAARVAHQQAAAQQAIPRTNEYFVPKDGIDREVITADICRYLGNDALVRPGNYENPQTRVVQAGYYINAYRNLTSEMIADLKADSQRWDAERRQTASRGQPQNVEYRSSTTHQSRQYYGPTEATPQAQSGYSTGGYQGLTATAQQQQGYDGTQYQSGQYSGQPAQAGKYGATTAGYIPTTQGYAQQEPYYVGGHMEMVQDQSRQDRGSANVPRTQPLQSYATPTYSQADRSGYYQAGPSPVSTNQSGYQQPPDPFYGRVPPVAGTTGYDTATPDMYDQRNYPDPRTQSYQDTTAYSQAPVAAASNPTASAQTTRRGHGEREDRDSRHHRRR